MPQATGSFCHVSSHARLKRRKRRGASCPTIMAKETKAGICVGQGHPGHYPWEPWFSIEPVRIGGIVLCVYIYIYICIHTHTNIGMGYGATTINTGGSVVSK